MRKRMVMLILCGVLTLAGNAQVFAEDIADMASMVVSPRMDYIDFASANLIIDSAGNATIRCSAQGYSGTTTRMEISAKLQRYVDGKWVTLKTFTANSNSYSVSLRDSYKVSKGYTYRVRATVHAYSGSSAETRTVTSSEVNY